MATKGLLDEEATKRAAPLFSEAVSDLDTLEYVLTGLAYDDHAAQLAKAREEIKRLWVELCGGDD